MLDTWSVIASLPEPVNNCSATSCRGKIYCIGAQYDINDLVLQVYTPEKGIFVFRLIFWNQFINCILVVSSIIWIGGLCGHRRLKQAII